MRRTDTVTPEIGLFDDPSSPAMYPAIALATKAKSIAKTAIIAETAHISDIYT